MHIPSQAARVLRPKIIVELLGATLMRGHAPIASYHCYDCWMMSLKLLPIELRGLGNSSIARLQVLHQGGAHRLFKICMKTYVGLLHEDAFACMRKDLRSLRAGRIDKRDLQVHSDVHVVAIGLLKSSGSGTGQGIFVGLRCNTSASARRALPMFGSLLALAL